MKVNAKSIAKAVLVLILLGGIVYFLGKGTRSEEATPMESRVGALEQKIAGLEKQIAELQEKITVSRPAPVVAPKPTPPASSKPAVSLEKQYHTVQKGESLSGISNKYKVSVEELRKLNNLSATKPIRVGQKLLVSRER